MALAGVGAAQAILVLPGCPVPATASPSPQVESRRVHDGAQPGAFQGPGVGLAAQVASGLAQGGSSRGLTHGNLTGEWRVVRPDAEGRVIVQELWSLMDDGTAVQGTRRYDPDFDPALALTPKRPVEGSWTVAGLKGEWLVELANPGGAIRMVGEKSFDLIPATPGEPVSRATWIGGPSPPPSPSPKPSPQAVARATPSPSASPSTSPRPSVSPQADAAASQAQG